MKAITKKNNWIYVAVLALQYLVCGSVYISQMYYLYNFFSADIVTIIALRWNYIAQSLGMLVFILLYIKAPRVAGDRKSYAISIAVGTLFMVFSLISNNGAIAVSLSIAFNILIGLYSGYTLTSLASHIPQRALGMAFAIAYAFGSVGTYIISIMGNGNFLQSKYVLIVFLIINIFSVLLLNFSENIDPAEQKADKHLVHKVNKTQIYILILLLLILINTISSLGNNFQFAVVVEGNANLPLSRAFYAIGLLSAGLISLKSRKYLALTTFAFLLYPVVSVILAGDSSLASILLTLSYLFLGFVSVYRSLITMDIAAKNNTYLAFACFGLLISRTVEAATTFFSNITATNKLMAGIVFSVLFALLIFVFFTYFQKIYLTPNYKTTIEDSLTAFARKYNLTVREKEVFQLLIKGNTNREIAQFMYVTENTVKFHVKHLLKKTDCSNRLDLITLFNTMHDHDIPS